MGRVSAFIKQELNLTLALDYDGNGNLIYVGMAKPGTAQSAAGWQIKKLTYSAGQLVSIAWAGGTDEMVSVWNDRTTLTYS